MAAEDQPVISASELGEFAYCRRAWWLGRVQGLPSANRTGLARGQALHEGHGRRARHAESLRSAAAWVFLLAAVLTVAGIYLLLAG